MSVFRVGCGMTRSAGDWGACDACRYAKRAECGTAVCVAWRRPDVRMKGRSLKSDRGSVCVGSTDRKDSCERLEFCRLQRRGLRCDTQSRSRLFRAESSASVRTESVASEKARFFRSSAVSVQGIKCRPSVRRCCSVRNYISIRESGSSIGSLAGIPFV